MRRQTKYLVVHCSATRSNQDIGADEIRQMHLNRGWKDIGYHAVIRRNGQIEYGRHFDETGAHVKSHNFQSVGVCLVGGVDHEGKAENNYTHAQMTSLYALLVVLKRSYPHAKIVGHRDLSPDLDGDGVIEKHEWVKDCPCFDVQEWVKRWKEYGSGSNVSG
jgi:N-acetyl-anhydromuramyl-L-alanine amidase AmpD